MKAPKGKPTLRRWAYKDMLDELERFVASTTEQLEGGAPTARRAALRRLRDVVLATRGAKVAFDLQVVMWRASHVVEHYADDFVSNPARADRVLDAALRFEFEDASKTSRKGDVAVGVLLDRVRAKLGAKGRAFIREHASSTATAYLLIRAGVLPLRGSQGALSHDDVLADSDGLKDRARDVRRARAALDVRGSS